MTFVETDGIIAIEAEHYAEAESGDGGKFEKIPEYGKTLSGMKAYPCDRTFAENEGPKLIYRIYVEEEGNYRILLYTAPANPLNQWDRVISKRKGNKTNPADTGALYLGRTILSGMV